MYLSSAKQGMLCPPLVILPFYMTEGWKLIWCLGITQGMHGLSVLSVAAVGQFYICGSLCFLAGTKELCHRKDLAFV